MTLSNYIQQFNVTFPELAGEAPWEITQAAALIIAKKIKSLNGEFRISGNIAIHKDAQVEEHVIIKGPAIISAGCFVASHAYIRGGVYLDKKVTIGPGVEIKGSYIFADSALAHFNFAGDSIIGANVNMEAGAVIANYFNERKDKTITLMSDAGIVATEVEKFGAIVGDHSKIGANAVLSPGTLLPPKSIVKRLELISQQVS